MNNINYIGGDELVFNSDESGGINSGGFSVNSIMMKAGMSPIMTLNTQQTGGTNNVSDLFNNLVIPNWTLTYNDRIVGGSNKDLRDNNDSDSEDDVIDNDLHDKLLDLVREHDIKSKVSKKKMTKKYKNKNKEKKNTMKKRKSL